MNDEIESPNNVNFKLDESKEETDILNISFNNSMSMYNRPVYKSQHSNKDKDEDVLKQFPMMPVHKDCYVPRKRLCMYCRNLITTKYKKKIKPQVWIAFVILVFIFGPFGLMIFWVEASYEYRHYCPNCNESLAWEGKSDFLKKFEKGVEFYYILKKEGNNY